jgi:two-component system cell cycle sensor histidine kinase/response regulator CckA
MPTILVAEDSPTLRGILVYVLREAGYEVLPVESGEEALRLTVADVHFDVLVTDNVMVGIDGGELARRVTRLRPGVPVILISGADAEGAREGTTRFLLKPFSVEELEDEVAAALGASSQ